MLNCVALTAADLEWLLAANPDDNAEAAYWIAYCHFKGTGGVQINDKTAVLYFEKAAKHNHAKGLSGLARCYSWGLGASRDETRATQLFQKAHEALQSELQEDPNDAEAQCLLGFSHSLGYGGLNKDNARAFSLFQQAAQQGHVNGQCNVGYGLKYGDGVTKDCVQAAGWYGQAARQGDPFAKYNFDNLFKTNAELKEQLAAVAQNGARDQQKTFLAASALAYYWTQTNGTNATTMANSTAAQQWQAVADQCTNKLPPSWRPPILVERHLLSKSPAEEERRRTEEVARLRQEAERWRQKAAEAEQEVARLRQEAERRRREEERKHCEAEEAERRRREEENRNRREARYGQREESQAPPIRSGAFDRRATSPLRKLQNIQNNNDVPVRQAQLAALVQELQVYCNRRSANKPEVFRVLGYCCDHGIGMEQEDKEQAFRLYVKADKLVGIKPAAVKKGWFGFRKTNPATLCSSAEWLYKCLKDERVTCYETRFGLDEALALLSTNVTRARTSRDPVIIRRAIRCELEFEFLQGLLPMDEFTSEAELRKKADKLGKQVDRAKDNAKRLLLSEELVLVEAQLKKEVMAREGAELERRQGAAAASHTPPPPSAPLEEELPPDASVPIPRSCQ